MDTLPEKIGGCRIEAKLGQGGMGAVYRARHETLQRDVAIKLLPPAFTQNAEYVQRFLREARAAAQLIHPNIVQVYDAGEQNGQYYITMEFVDGTSLSARLQGQGVLSEPEALNYLVQAARGLAAAHARGLIHRDIKPENLLINRENIIKIADFGLVSAGIGDSALTQAGATLGTPLYMSPEQGEGLPADARSDLYSLGVTFFRALTGATPFTAPTPVAVIFKHKHEPTPHPQSLKPALSPQTSQLLLRLLAKRPEERYQRAEDVAREAEALLVQMQTAPVGAVAASPLDPAFMPTMRVTPAPAAPAYAPPATPPPAYAAARTPAPAYPTPAPAYAAPAPTPAPVYQTPPPAYATPQPGAVATPMPAGYAPTPGLPMPAPLTPPPVAPPKKSAAGWMLAAAAFLILVAGGGVFGYFKYHDMKVDEAKQKAQDARALKQYDAAISTLEAAYTRYPDRPELKALRDRIEADAVNEKVVKLKEKAQQALETENYQGAVVAYTEARELLQRYANLPGVEADGTLPDRQKRAENLVQFTRLMSAAHTDEKEGRFEKAVLSYQEAAKYEVKGGSEAATGATRAQYKALSAEAESQEGSGRYAEALETLGRAAALKVEDVAARQEKLRKTIEYQRLTAEAGKAVDDRRPRDAAVLLEKAAGYAATPADAEELHKRAKQLTLSADFGDQMASGEAALKERRWADAQNAFRAAGKLKPDSAEPGARLKKVLAGEQLEKGAAAAQKSDWKAALEFYQAGAQADPENEACAAGVREIQGKMSTVNGVVEAARQDETSGDWAGAFRKWQQLVTLDPNNKTVYEQRATNAKFEQAMAAARTAEQAGQLDEALAQAKAAQPYDSTGGQRAQAMVQSLETKLRAREQAAMVRGAVERAMTQVKQGQVREAGATLAAAAQADPQNVQVANLKTSLDGVEVIERGYGRLEAVRQEAEAAIQTSAKVDDDKKIAGWLADVQGWQPKIAEARGAARAAWLGGRYEEIAPKLASLRAMARETGQLYYGIGANFHGMAASEAKPKANIGGIVGGFGGRGFGGITANADVGDNQKKAGIFDATARALDQCSATAREMGAE